MTDHALTEITIKNFKCFTELHLDGFERVNLIGGKNNVGKTAFLEAVELNVILSRDINYFSFVINQLLTRRQKNIKKLENIEYDFFYNLKLELQITSNKYAFKLNREDLKKISELKTDIEYLEGFFEKNWGFGKNWNDKINFIKSTIIDEHEISEFYGIMIDLNKEAFLNQWLQSFDDNIATLKQRIIGDDVIFKVELKNRERAVLLSSLGDGVNRFIGILCAIWASQDGFLLIDEVENGIHYTNYPKLWKLIFQASKDANCQLFITTHSKECIEAFNEANTAEQGAYFEFYKNRKQNKIMAHKRDNQQLAYALENDRRIRGE